MSTLDTLQPLLPTHTRLNSDFRFLVPFVLINEYLSISFPPSSVSLRFHTLFSHPSSLSLTHSLSHSPSPLFRLSPPLHPHSPSSPPCLSLFSSLNHLSPSLFSPSTHPTASCQLPPSLRSLHLSHTCSHVSSSPPHNLHLFSTRYLPSLIPFPNLKLTILLHLFSPTPFSDTPESLPPSLPYTIY